jgi:hypothetical protein
LVISPRVGIFLFFLLIIKFGRFTENDNCVADNLGLLWRFSVLMDLAQLTLQIDSHSTNNFNWAECCTTLEASIGPTFRCNNVLPLSIGQFIMLNYNLTGLTLLNLQEIRVA